MNYKAAERYAEALLFARKSVKKGVAAARAQQCSKRRDFLGVAAGKGYISDPTAAQAVKRLAPLPVLRCAHEGHSFVVVHPEKWLEVMQKAFVMYGERFGDEALLTMRHRYDGWSVQRICQEEGISKRLYQFRRTEFLHCLMLYAVQSGVVAVD